MNAFYSFIDRVVDERAEMAANALSIDQVQDVNTKTSSRKVIQPQHLAIVKKNATRAIEQFVEATKRKEIAEAAQNKLNSSDHISRQDSHQSGNYASLNIDIEHDFDETILEKGLSIVSKDWKAIIELGDREEELKSRIQTLEALDRLDVKGRLAQVNGAMSMYIMETRKARILDWVQWRREELEAVEAQAIDEEVETADEEEDLAVLQGVDVEMVVESDDENETTSEEEDLGVPTGVDIKMVVESDNEDEDADSDEDSGVSESDAVEEDVDNRSDASSHSDDSTTEEVKLETNEKSTHSDPVDTAKSQEPSKPALSQFTSPETEVHEPMVENVTSPSKIEAIDDHASEDQKADSVLEDTTKPKHLSRTQKRNQKKAAKKAREEAATAAQEVEPETPAPEKPTEEQTAPKKISPVSTTRHALEQISAPDTIAIAYEFNESGTQVTIDIVLSNPENIDLLFSSSDSPIPMTTSLSVYYPNHDDQYPNHPYAVASCDISSTTVSELLQLASTLMKARGYLTAKRDNYIWTEAVKRKFHGKAMSKVLTMPLINRAKLAEVPDMEVLGSASSVVGHEDAEEGDEGEVEDDEHGEEDPNAEDGENLEDSEAKDGGDQEDQSSNDGGHFSIVDLFRGLYQAWDDMGTFGWLALAFLVWLFLAYIGGYQGGELVQKR